METEKFNQLKELFETRDQLARIKEFTDANPDGTWIFRGVEADGETAAMHETAMPDALRTRFAQADLSRMRDSQCRFRIKCDVASLGLRVPLIAVRLFCAVAQVRHRFIIATSYGFFVTSSDSGSHTR